MSQEIFFRALIAGIISLGIAWILFSNYDAEEGPGILNRKYRPYVSGSLLPLWLLFFTIVSFLLLGAARTIQNVLSMCVNIFLHIGVYYLVLPLVIPFFRKRISARACAVLWMVPNYLYITLYGTMELPKPGIVIPIPGNLIWVLLFIWFSGFLIVLCWKTSEHLLFRRRILAHSAPAADPESLSVWKEVLAASQIKKQDIPLLTSPDVKTPLSIGLFPKTVRVVLPAQEKYEPGDLKLILEHELVHIARDDAWAKYFLIFCTAMCWFNPFMWKAMKSCAEDLELSCDETVLLGADSGTRRQYASLLLETAGDERGFTTCLSASAKSMRYRLKNIMAPAKRSSGALTAGFIFFVLCMTSGYVALAYGGKSGAEAIYPSGDYSQCTLRYISMSDDEYHTEYDIADEEAFHEYLSGLTLLELTGSYSFSEYGKQVTYIMDMPDGTLGIILYDDVIKVSPYLKSAAYYYVKDGIDWNYIDTLLVPLPALNVHLTGGGEPQGKDFSTLLTRAWKTADGEKRLVYDPQYPKDMTHGLFGYDPFEEATFSFSKELAAPCSVLIESWDRSESYTVTQEDLTQPFVLELPAYRAHYTVYASFYEPNAGLYEAEFLFDIGDVGE